MGGGSSPPTSADDAGPRSDDPYKALIDEAPDGIVILERGCIVYINATASHLLGVDQAVALGLPIARFLPPEDAAGASL